MVTNNQVFQAYKITSAEIAGERRISKGNDPLFNRIVALHGATENLLELGDSGIKPGHHLEQMIEQLLNGKLCVLDLPPFSRTASAI